MEQLLGRSLGAYQLVELLEPEGILARFRAIDRRLFNRPVVVNVFDFDANSEDLVARFERVAAELVELRHPCILPLQDFGEQGRHAYVVSPFIESTRLSQLIARPFEEEAALRAIAALADALDHAHRRGIVHRAIAPATIALTGLSPDGEQRDGWPIFTAFGFAAIDEHLIAHPDVAPYQPPESGSGIDYGRVDLYSLAAVLVALLTGQPPPSDAKVRDAVLAPDLAPVLRRALSFTPAERFGTGAEFVAALRQATGASTDAGLEDPLALLDQARAAVAAGRYRAAGRAYTVYLERRPDDDMARREFVAIQSRIPRVRTQAPMVSPAAEPPPPAPTPEAPGATTNEAVGGATAAPRSEGGLRQLLPAEAGATSQRPADPHAPGSARGTARWPLRRRPRAERGGQAPENARTDAPPRTLPSTYRPGQSPAPGPLLRPLVAPAVQRQRLVLPSVLAAVALLLAVTVVGGAVLRRGQSGVTGSPASGGGTAQVVISAGDATPRATVTTVAPGTSGPNAGSTPSTVGNVIATIPIAPTGRPVTPSPSPTRPPLPPVLVDEFGDPNSGFPRQPGSQANPAYWNGEYIIVVPNPNDLTVADLAGKVYGDLVIEFDVRAVGPTNGGLYGLVFHKIENQDGIDEYFLLVDPGVGAARLVRWAGTTATELLPMTPNAAIKTGEAVNHIEVTAKANMITVVINGTRIVQVTGNGPQSGGVGLRADAGTAQFEAHFDNFIIRPAP